MNYSISQTTQYTPDEIMNEILLKMYYKDYEIISHDDKNLNFNGCTRNISRRSIVWYIRFYEGKFRITDDGSKRIVRLQYQVFSTIELILSPIIVGFPLTMGIIEKSSFGYAAASIFLFMLILNFFTLYFTAKNMLKDILF